MARLAEGGGAGDVGGRQRRRDWLVWLAVCEGAEVEGSAEAGQSSSGEKERRFLGECELFEVADALGLGVQRLSVHARPAAVVLLDAAFLLLLYGSLEKELSGLMILVRKRFNICLGVTKLDPEILSLASKNANSTALGPWGTVDGSTTYKIECALDLLGRDVLARVPDIDEAVLGRRVDQGLGDLELVHPVGGDVDDGNIGSFRHDVSLSFVLQASMSYLKE